MAKEAIEAAEALSASTMVTLKNNDATIVQREAVSVSLTSEAAQRIQVPNEMNITVTPITTRSQGTLNLLLFVCDRSDTFQILGSQIVPHFYISEILYSKALHIMCEGKSTLAFCHIVQ